MAKVHFLIELMEIMTLIEGIRANGAKVEFEECSHKDYYSIIVTFKDGNAVFSDVAILYTDDQFDKEDTIEQLKGINSTALRLFNK